MNATPIIRPNTCATCALKVGVGNELYCRLNPPSTHPVFTMTPKGPQLAGQVSLFPKVEPTWWCGQWAGISAVSRSTTIDAPVVAAN